MGWLSSIGDAISDAADSVADAVSDTAEAAYDTVASGAVGKAIAEVATVVDTATGGLAGAALEATDDVVFDTVDYVTAGAVNVDFDDGNFSVGAGIEGLAYAGASIGESGISANGEVLYGTSFDVAMTDAGFTASGSAGIDWGPLPYAAGHVEMLPNGDVKVNGEFQGTLPTPYGIFSGEGRVGFESTEAGWGGYIDSQGQWIMPSGTTIAAGEHFAYQQNADGSSELSVGVNGSVGYVGGPSFGGGVDYARADDGAGNVVQSVGVDGHVSYMGMTARGEVDYQRAENADGDVVEHLGMEGEVDALGMRAGAEADYRHADIDGVEQSDWSADADFEGPDTAEVVGAAGTALKAYAGSDADVADDALGAAADMGADDALGAVADTVPVDDFDAAMGAAESVEQSMDDLTQDLP